MHLRIQLPLLVFHGTGRCYKGGVHDRALAHRHTPRIEVDCDGLKDLLEQLVLLQQGPKVRIVVSSGIRSLISSMQAKRRMVVNSIPFSSMVGLMREYHCCSR